MHPISLTISALIGWLKYASCAAAACHCPRRPLSKEHFATQQSVGNVDLVG